MIPPPRPEIARLHGYAPGEQPAAGTRVVKLNTNEASFPPPPSVVEAAAVTAETLRRYPDPRATKLREAIAARHGLTADHVLVGNGSDDILTILLRTYVAPGGRVAFPWPTYSLYPTLCEIQGATPVKIDWAGEWGLPSRAILDAAPDAVFLTNPNAPSGTVVSAQAVDVLAEELGDRLLLIDEAYADYADRDFVGLVEKHPNVVVSRSFSKGFALAGARLGYAIARPDAVEQMDKVRDSYNVDAVAQAIGLAAIAEGDYYDRERKAVVERRGRLADGLGHLGFDVLPSQANFLFARWSGTPEAGELYRGLKAKNVLVRHWDQPGIRDFLRVTVGTELENATLLDALGSLIR